MSWQGGTRRGEHRDTGDRGIPRATDSGDDHLSIPPAGGPRGITWRRETKVDRGRPRQATGHGFRIWQCGHPQWNRRETGDHGTQRPREITGRRFRIWQRGHSRDDHGEPLGDGRPRETTRDHGPRIQDRHPQGRRGDHRRTETT